MAISTGGTGGGPQSDINMTPMIDVLLVLLIIFLVIQPTLQEGIQVDVPVVRQAETSDQPEQVVLRIGPGPAYEINGEAVPLDAIAPRLEAALEGSRDRIVFVDGSEDLSYGQVIRAIDEARRVGGLQSIGLVPRSERERVGAGGAP